MQRFKPKRRIKKKALIKFILLIIISVVLIKVLYKNIYGYKDILKEKLTFLGINSISSEEKNIVDQLYKYTKESIINKPKLMLVSNIKYKSNKKVSEKEKDTLDTKTDIIDNNPLIYIYSSHQKEEYARNNLDDYNITPNVFLASQILQEKLENRGVKTIVMQDDITKYLNDNKMDYSKSYLASRHFLELDMNKYSTIKLFIDLHRDAAKKDVTTVNIDGKNYARVMFVIGMEYNTYEINLSLANSINNIIDQLYPNLSRGVLKKAGYGVNGVYNQDLKDNIILIELGGNENSLEEVNNTIDVLANILGDYVNG